MSEREGGRKECGGREGGRSGEGGREGGEGISGCVWNVHVILQKDLKIVFLKYI